LNGTGHSLIPNFMSSLPKVIFLSSTPAGKKLLVWLKELPCQIVLAETDDRKLTAFPPCDVAFGYLYTHRIPESEFVVPYRWVNFHPGPLPEMRGRNLAYHAIMQGRPTFGATIHYMDRAFDTGEIIETVHFPIEPGHTAGDLVHLSHKVLQSLFKKYAPLLLRGKIPSAPQAAGQYYKKESIKDEVDLTEAQARLVRAVTVAPRFHAKVSIGGRIYNLVPEEIRA